jgi:antitoxin component YwqK of YwqJK toxin-antitoxin module
MRTIAVIFIFILAFLHLDSMAQSPEEISEMNKTDEKGQKQGPWKKTDKEGRLVYSGTFINDKPTGRFIYYDSTGAKKAESAFRENGSKAFTVTFYRSGVKLSEGLYINEKRDSIWNFYNEEGILISEETYREGKAEGIWKTYYANKSILEEVTYRSGVKEGPWKQYYYDGPVKLSATYKNGKLEGLATFYHPSGRVMVSGPYTNNLKDGVWMHLNDKGVAEKREVWSAGFLSVEEYYDKAMEKMAKEEK